MKSTEVHSSPGGPFRFWLFMQSEAYDPERIYEVWAEMASSPEMRERMLANDEVGVCARNYTQRPGGSAV